MAAEERFFYANSCEVFCSPYDAGIRLQRSVSVESSGIPRGSLKAHDSTSAVAESMVVNMSLQHAKTLVAAMVAMIELYEKQWGEVPVKTGGQFWEERKRGGL